jgi:hypothetical protein
VFSKAVQVCHRTARDCGKQRQYCWDSRETLFLEVSGSFFSVSWGKTWFICSFTFEPLCHFWLLAPSLKEHIFSLALSIILCVVKWLAAVAKREQERLRAKEAEKDT